MLFLALFFILVYALVFFPIGTYFGARLRGNSPEHLSKIALISFAIPVSMCVVAFVANIAGIGVDHQSISENTATPREFFAALDEAGRKYENVVASCVLLQILLIVGVTLYFSKVRLYALSLSMAGLVLSIISSVIALNLLGVDWPGT